MTNQINTTVIMKTFYTIILLTIGQSLSAQQSLTELQPSKEYENILVEKLTTDEYASCYVIWVKKEVTAHKHEHHTENLYIIDGSGKMLLGNKTIQVKAGDFLTIPHGTIHSVKVTSEIPLKVMSVQAPEFLGKDRVFVE